MNVRNWLIKWLNIRQPETIDKDELERLVRKAILDCFNNIPCYYGWEGRTRLEEMLRKLIRSEQESAVSKLVQSHLNGESFLDALVKRIKDKQL